MSVEIQDLAARYGAAWAEHDLKAIMAMHTEDTVFHLHGGVAASLRWDSLPRARHLPPRPPNGPTFGSTRAGSTSATDTSSASIR
jgi:hypothetical protein